MINAIFKLNMMLRRLMRLMFAALFILIFSLGFNFLRIFQASSYLDKSCHISDYDNSINCFQDYQNTPSRSSLISRLEVDDKSTLKKKMLIVPETFDIHRLAIIFSQFNNVVDRADYQHIPTGNIFPSSHEPLFIRVCSLLI